MNINLPSFAVANVTVDEALSQQKDIVIITGAFSVLVLPFAIYTTYITFLAKIRPLQFVASMFTITIPFYIAFQTLWYQVLKNCKQEEVEGPDIESLVDCTATNPGMIA